jgi:hypothetical protein
MDKPRPIAHAVRILGTTLAMSAAALTEHQTLAKYKADHVMTDCATVPPKPPDAQEPGAPPRIDLVPPVAEIRPVAMPPPQDVPWTFFEQDADDDTHLIVETCQTAAVDLDRERLDLQLPFIAQLSAVGVSASAGACDLRAG